MSTNKNNSKKDNYYMLLALKQAERLLGNTGTNPSVGCIVVRNNCVISSGFTGFNGQPHAEQSALNMSRLFPNKSDLYVTLEPCTNYGKTPPCTRLIIKKKISKVFFSLKDPDIRSHDKCIKTLKKNNIFAQNGLLGFKLRNFYESYFKYKKNQFPFLTAKLAVSRDFYTYNKKRKWLTNKFSRGRVHIMRSQNDCVLTSVKTIIKDNPMLTCRINGMENRSPARIILDKDLKIPKNSKIVKSSKIYKTFVFFDRFDKKKIKFLKKMNVRLIRVSLNADTHFDLKNILREIKSLGFARIFLESGINLMNSFLKENLIDEFKLFISNKKLGKSGLYSFKRYMRILPKKNNSYNDINLFGDKLISYKIK